MLFRSNVGGAITILGRPMSVSSHSRIDLLSRTSLRIFFSFLKDIELDTRGAEHGTDCENTGDGAHTDDDCENTGGGAHTDGDAEGGGHGIAIESQSNDGAIKDSLRAIGADSSSSHSTDKQDSSWMLDWMSGCIACSCSFVSPLLLSLEEDALFFLLDELVAAAAAARRAA